MTAAVPKYCASAFSSALSSMCPAYVYGQKQMLKEERKCREMQVLSHRSTPASSCLRLSSFHHSSLGSSPAELMPHTAISISFLQNSVTYEC